MLTLMNGVDVIEASLRVYNLGYIGIPMPPCILNSRNRNARIVDVSDKVPLGVSFLYARTPNFHSKIVVVSKMDKVAVLPLLSLSFPIVKSPLIRPYKMVVKWIDIAKQIQKISSIQNLFGQREPANYT